MRRLITLHIGRGLALHRPALRIASLFSWLAGTGSSPARIDLPGARDVPLQLEGLHPVDAAALARSLHARGHEHPVLATNDATVINAIAEACAEGELRIISHGWGCSRQWDIDEAMAFHGARAAGSALAPATMLLRMGLWT